MKLAKYLISAETYLVGTTIITNKGFHRINTVQLGRKDNIKLAKLDDIAISGYIVNRNVYCLSMVTTDNDVGVQDEAGYTF